MYFIDQMFNPETVNPEYYESVRFQIAQYNWEQDKEIRNAVKAIYDLCSAVKNELVTFIGNIRNSENPVIHDI